jgi:hypothetical protein
LKQCWSGKDIPDKNGKISALFAGGGIPFVRAHVQGRRPHHVMFLTFLAWVTENFGDDKKGETWMIDPDLNAARARQSQPDAWRASPLSFSNAP